MSIRSCLANLILYSIYLLCNLGIWVASAYANTRTDSLQLSQIEKMSASRKLLSPVFSHNEREIGQGKLDFYYQYASGDLRKAQEAFTDKKTNFYAEGFRNLGRFRVAATFQFNKIFEDSLANGQRNNLDDFSTFYAYANKSGDYERQNYQAQTSVLYDVLAHWALSLNVDYHSHWSAGKDDPRLKSDVFLLKAAPGIQFKNENHAVGIQFSMGKGDESSSLMYKNREFQSSLLYPDRIHYMNYGYGSSVIKDSSRVYRKQEFIGASVAYQQKSEQEYWRFRTEYERKFEENSNLSRSSNQNTGPVGTMTTDQFRIHGSWNKRNSATQHFVFTDWSLRSSFDGNIKTSGTLDKVNYEMRQILGEVHYKYQKTYHRSRNPQNFTLGAFLKLVEEEREDHHSSVRLFSQNLLIGLPSEFEWKSGGSDWYLSLTPGFQTPIAHDFQFNPLSMTEFIRNVVFTDAYYQRLTKFSGHFQLEWIHWPLYNQKIGLFTDILWEHALKPAIDTSFAAKRIPFGNRCSIQTGIRMYIGQP